MNRSKIVIALACLLIPGLITTVWFYSGRPQLQSSPIPDYPTIDLPQAPISTEIPRQQPPSQPSTSILFDFSHGNLVSLSELDPFIRFIEARGGAIHTTSLEMDLTESLKSANAFVCLSPIQAYSEIDKNALSAFVKRGGKLLVAADPTRNTMAVEGMATGMKGVDAANLVLEPYDISFSDDYLYDMLDNEGNYRNVKLSSFDTHPLMKDVHQLVIYGGHSVKSSGKSLACSNESTFSSGTDHAGKFSPFALVNSGLGSVLAIGDLSILTSQYVQSADNQVFVSNLADFLTESNRQRNLADFPKIFSGNVILEPVQKIKVDGQMLTTISKLEKALGTPSGGLTISRIDDPSVNRILLTTFISSDETKGILEKLKINLSPKPEIEDTPELTPTGQVEPHATSTPGIPELGFPNVEFPKETISETPTTGPKEIEVPGMGVLMTSDLGLVGFVQEDKRSSLIIMAASPEKLQSFIEELSITSLSGCLIQNDLAACKVTGTNLEPKG
jgi:hypothetical protein